MAPASLLHNTAQSALWQIFFRMWHGHTPTRLVWMRKLMVTSARAHVVPPFAFQPLNDLPAAHGDRVSKDSSPSRRFLKKMSRFISLSDIEDPIGVRGMSLEAICGID
jgi:hypothetical protein